MGERERQRAQDRLREMQRDADSRRHVVTTVSREQAARDTVEAAEKYAAERGASSEDAARIAADACRGHDRKKGG